MYHYVYRTTCLVNGKTYIGVRSSKRWPVDDWYKGSGTALQLAFRKYGRDAFSKQVLVIVETRAEVLRIEALMVPEEVARDRSNYNRTRGGGSGPLFRQVTEAEKELHRARMNDPVVKERMRQLNLGNQRRKGTVGSDRQRQAVSESNRRRACK